MDPWAVLGLAAGASLDDARRAYLVRLQLVHPDRHQGEAAAVVAEAERATRELNAAWEAVQRLCAVGGAPPGPVRGVTGPPTEPAACLQWAIDRLIDAGARSGRPLSASEVELLRRPRAAAPSGRRFRQWVTGRRATLAAAVAADGTDAWAVVVRVLSDGGPSVVLGLLFSS